MLENVSTEMCFNLTIINNNNGLRGIATDPLNINLKKSAAIYGDLLSFIAALSHMTKNIRI